MALLKDDSVRVSGEKAALAIVPVEKSPGRFSRSAAHHRDGGLQAALAGQLAIHDAAEFDGDGGEAAQIQIQRLRLKSFGVGVVPDGDVVAYAVELQPILFDSKFVVSGAKIHGAVVFFGDVVGGGFSSCDCLPPSFFIHFPVFYHLFWQAFLDRADSDGSIQLTEHVKLSLGDAGRGAHAKPQVLHPDGIAPGNFFDALGVFVLECLFQLHHAGRDVYRDLSQLIFLDKFLGALPHAGVRGCFLVFTGKVERVDFLEAGDAGSRDGLQIVVLIFLAAPPVGIHMSVHLFEASLLAQVDKIHAVLDDSTPVYHVFPLQGALEAVEDPHALVGRGDVVGAVGQHGSTQGHGLFQLKAADGAVVRRLFRGIVVGENKVAVSHGVHEELRDHAVQAAA